MFSTLGAFFVNNQFFYMKKEHKYQGRSQRQQENNELIAFMVVAMLAIGGLYLLITKFVL